MTVNRIAAWGSAAVVAAAVIVGLWLAGSPPTLRLERLDEKRVADLKVIAGVINDYWKTHGALPASLTDVVDGLRLSSVPTDPVTEAPYRYSAAPPNRFDLCADFALASRPEDGDDFWRHQADRHCYTFEALAAP